MLLERLKIETRAYHDRLECVVGLAASVEEHCRQLERFYGFAQTWEPRVQPLGAAMSNLPPGFWQARRKLPRLEADLRYFGYDTETLARLPVCLDLPSLNTLPQMLGSAYVLEGATLGGQIIARHLEQTLGLTDGQGYAFFQSYGKDTARRWKTFGQMLLAYVAGCANVLPTVAAAHSVEAQGIETHSVGDAIVQSACDTFASLQRWFERDASSQGLARK